ncbi:MAG: hypothetical protein AAF961_13295, partial [Planctomycetota bacterium]
MAAKENQGLQALIIVLALLVVGLGVGLIFVNNAKSTAQARADQADSDAQNQQNAARGAQQEANFYKESMGFSEGDARDQMEKFIKQDFDTYGQTVPEEERN